LFQAKKRYGLCILNYMITSNHMHLIVKDTGVDIISHSMQLVAGRVAQEFNSRKGRSGAFWQDRYHATAVEDDLHLVRAMIYIDLNMVRAGVVSHPSQWPFCGYYELMRPRNSYSIIDRGELMRILDTSDDTALMGARRDWVDDALERGPLCRDDRWTDSLAVGGRVFLEAVKRRLGPRARGRRLQLEDGLGVGVLKERPGAYRRCSGRGNGT
jgi:putative transposase